ncbi:MAG: sirohydrochlorin cobaltochelatase [Verrucomicrobiota bacterium]|jgi:sirohydrochlorin cobaltochelatase
MRDAIERALAAVITERLVFGQILITKPGDFAICHRDDEGRAGLRVFQQPGDAVAIARFDDSGNYRPLTTAPNLCHGWRLDLLNIADLRLALDAFYPGRLAVFAAWQADLLRTTTLRETLGRQSGMYRIANSISDEQANDLVGNFCRSNGGCLRTILWKLNSAGAVPSTKLPPPKFDAGYDQAAGQEAGLPTSPMIPLLCQEACNLLVNECRKIVKVRNTPGS